MKRNVCISNNFYVRLNYYYKRFETDGLIRFERADPTGKSVLITRVWEPIRIVPIASIAVIYTRFMNRQRYSECFTCSQPIFD